MTSNGPAHEVPRRQPFVKVCGITRLEDARHAVTHGATALGFVCWPSSPRYVEARRIRSIVDALPSLVMTVGVFVNESVAGITRVVEEAGLTAVQLHGDEPPAFASALAAPLFRSVGVDTPPDAWGAWPDDTTLLLDAADTRLRGGTGRAVDWNRAAGLARVRRLVLAGGLTPANVAEAIAIVRPYGVDVSSGVEQAPGVKDFDKMTEFLENARAAFEQP